jgi:hypothetical protein
VTFYRRWHSAGWHWVRWHSEKWHLAGWHSVGWHSVGWHSNVAPHFYRTNNTKASGFFVMPKTHITHVIPSVIFDVWHYYQELFVIHVTDSFVRRQNNHFSCKCPPPPQHICLEGGESYNYNYNNNCTLIPFYVCSIAFYKHVYFKNRSVNKSINLVVFVVCKIVWFVGIHR